MAEASNTVIRIPLARMAVVTVLMPLGAFLTCIYLSLRYNFDLSTATHCGVCVHVSLNYNNYRDHYHLSLPIV